MTMTVFVGSKQQSDNVVAVEADGINQTEARQRAIQFARARHRIGDPVALTEHQAAVRKRSQVLRRECKPMPVERPIPFWRQRNQEICYDEK